MSLCTIWPYIKQVTDPVITMPEINVKGKIIYGYTWKVRNLNEGDGYYRLTFSFDNDGHVPLNTFFDSNTKILVAEEVVEEKVDVLAEAEEGDRGGVGVMDVDKEPYLYGHFDHP